MLYKIPAAIGCCKSFFFNVTETSSYVEFNQLQFKATAITEYVKSSGEKRRVPYNVRKKKKARQRR